jgi:hypothetical protein
MVGELEVVPVSISIPELQGTSRVGGTKVYDDTTCYWWNFQIHVKDSDRKYTY